MTPEQILRDKLRKIEALFAGGQRQARKLLQERLRNVSASVSEKPRARKSQSS